MSSTKRKASDAVIQASKKPSQSLVPSRTEVPSEVVTSDHDETSDSNNAPAPTAPPRTAVPRSAVAAAQEEEVDTAPAWIRQGHVIQASSGSPIESLGLSDRVLGVLRDAMRIHSWFAMQAEVIPAILQARLHGHDVCVSAPTGSGKTLAYVVPIVSVRFLFSVFFSLLLLLFSFLSYS